MNRDLTLFPKFDKERLIVRSWLEEMEVKKKKKKSWRIREIVEEYYWNCGGAYPREKLFCKFVQSWRIIGLDCWCFVSCSVFLCIFWESFPFQEMHFTGKGTKGIEWTFVQFLSVKDGHVLLENLHVRVYSFLGVIDFTEEKISIWIDPKEKKICLRWVGLSGKGKNEFKDSKVRRNI